MPGSPSGPFLVIVVEPANDRGRFEAPVACWRIRWRRTGGIGRLRPAPPAPADPAGSRIVPEAFLSAPRAAHRAPFPDRS